MNGRHWTRAHRAALAGLLIAVLLSPVHAVAQMRGIGNAAGNFTIAPSMPPVGMSAPPISNNIPMTPSMPSAPSGSIGAGPGPSFGNVGIGRPGLTPDMPHTQMPIPSLIGPGMVRGLPSYGLYPSRVMPDDPVRIPQGPRGRGPTRNAAAPQMVADEILVETRSPLAAQELAALVRRLRLTLVASHDLPFLGTIVHRLRVPRGTALQTALRRARGDAAIRTAQANFIYRLGQAAAPVPAEAAQTAGDAPFGLEAQYALGLMQVPEAQKQADGVGVRVALIDSGVDADIAELKGSVAASFNASDDGAPLAEHGTAIAGAIAAHARLRGVAPGVTLLSARAFGGSAGGTGTTLAILRSLDWAGAQGARIVNMSFAGPADAAMTRALATLSGKGLVLIAASGNAGAKSAPLYPAADPNVIAVSATDSADRLFAAAVRGAHVALAAPGVDIFAAAPGGKYDVISGTSIAAAHVSGIAALMMQTRPELAAARLREALTGTARDLGPKGRDDQFGAGRVDAAAALRAVAGAMAASGARANSPQ